MTGSCEADACDRGVYSRGLCERHYRQRLRRGAVRTDAASRTCVVDGCDRPAVTRGWCHGHYLRWSRGGDVRAEVPLARPVRGTCGVPDCGRPSHSRGMCRTHVERLRSHGAVKPALAVRPVGNGWSISHGYRKVVVPSAQLHLTGGERYVLEHRLVMAAVLDRPLSPGEVVHHRNGDRLDNRPSNLELWSVDQPKGQRVQDKVHFALEILQAYAPQHLAAADPAPDNERPGDHE